MSASPYPYDTLFVESESAAAAPPGAPILTDEQVRRWNEEGFLFLDGVWPAELIARASEESHAVFPQPPPGDVAAAAEIAAQVLAGSMTAPGIAGDAINFPSLHAPATNEVTLHERCWKVVEQLLGTDDLRLAESIVISKYGANGQETPWHESGDAGITGDQQLHQDYSSDTLLIPPPIDPARGRFCEGVQCLLYYTDTDPHNGGPTMGVWDDGPIPESEWQRDYKTLRTIRGDEPEPLKTNISRGAAVRPDLYARERPLRCRRGTAVFYRYELWHRGSAMKPGGLRIMHSFAFRRADCPWLGGVAAGYGLEVSRMPRSWVAGLTVAQRNLLGFPQVGDPYWTADTINGVAEHYGGHHDPESNPEGIDMTPYAEACPELADRQDSAVAAGATGAAVAAALSDLMEEDRDGGSAIPIADDSSERDECPPVPGRWHFNPSTKFLAPERVAFPDGGADPASDGTVLSPAQIKRWHESGLLLLDGLFPQDLVAAATAAAAEHGDEGGQYPYSGGLEVFNDITLHPNLLTAAAQILEDDDMRIYNGKVVMLSRFVALPASLILNASPLRSAYHVQEGEPRPARRTASLRAGGAGPASGLFKQYARGPQARPRAHRGRLLHLLLLRYRGARRRHLRSARPGSEGGSGGEQGAEDVRDERLRRRQRAQPPLPDGQLQVWDPAGQHAPAVRSRDGG